MPTAETTRREIEWGKLLDTALTVPGSLGNAYSRFYPYSFLNCVNLYAQGIEPQPVATYKRWKDIGRQVKRGAHAREIIRPITLHHKNAEGEIEYSFLRFKAVRCIFPLSDTEGPELPPAELPGWDEDRALTNLDIKRVPFNSMDGNTQGYSFGRNIAISEVAVNPTKTLFHEIGHVVLGHTIKEAMDGMQVHRGMREFQAETTAYLSLNELGKLDDETASRSRAYVQGWLSGESPGERDIRQVFGATDKILKAGRVAVAAEVEL